MFTLQHDRSDALCLAGNWIVEKDKTVQRFMKEQE